MYKYKVLDLFCGCGGISEGFRLAGCEIVMGIDINKAAIETYNKNFGNGKGICCNLLDYDEKKIVENELLKKGIDIIVGGPPCQGFSTANRWLDTTHDVRNQLFFEYLKFVDLLQPKAVLIENVAQIITKNDGIVKDTIYRLFEERGYTVNHRVLSSEKFGVPQKRKRNFFVILRNNLFDFDTIDESEQFNVKDAISDLYNYDINVDGIYKGKKATNGYLEYVRNSEYIYNHYISYPSLETQLKISYVPQGGNWRNIPENLFKTVRSNRHSSAYRRLSENSQSVTIDTGNAHSNYYHPIFNRIPTVREAARLQSFSDAFIFEGSKSEQYKQVGNAVPPLMAKAIAKAIIEVLDNEE